VLRPATVAIPAAAALALCLLLATGAPAKRPTTCERQGSTTLDETARVRVYDVRRGRAARASPRPTPAARARRANLGTRRTLSAPAEPAGAKEADWDAVRTLATAAGALVFSAQSPVNASAARPVIDARIALLGPERVVHELDRGPSVEADSLAVARRAGRPSLFTWRSGGMLRSAEL